MSLKLTHIIPDYLKKNAGQKFTARDIAQWILTTYPEECKEKQKRSKATKPLSTDATLAQQIAGEIGAYRPIMQKNDPNIKVTEGRPRKYYYSSQTDSAEIAIVESLDSKDTCATGAEKILEHDLYPKLSEFLWTELNIHSKRIDERCSKNTKGQNANKWLFPDIVGLENFSQGWNREIQDCVKQYGDKKTKLWSFEVKILINRSNIRESFFQAVSNSSWSNLGYLVASEIEGSDTLKELRLLSSLHGIGFIKLDIDNPSESEIIIPAKEKESIDWNNANRLADENKHFREFVKLVRQFYQTGEVPRAGWQEVKDYSDD